MTFPKNLSRLRGVVGEQVSFGRERQQRIFVPKKLIDHFNRQRHLRQPRTGEQRNLCRTIFGVENALGQRLIVEQNGADSLRCSFHRCQALQLSAQTTAHFFFASQRLDNCGRICRTVADAPDDVQLDLLALPLV